LAISKRDHLAVTGAFGNLSKLIFTRETRQKSSTRKSGRERPRWLLWGGLAYRKTATSEKAYRNPPSSGQATRMSETSQFCEGFRVQGSGFRVQGSGFKVQVLRITVPALGTCHHMSDTSQFSAQEGTRDRQKSNLLGSPKVKYFRGSKYLKSTRKLPRRGDPDTDFCVFQNSEQNHEGSERGFGA
jgi:hypothetical protein